MKQFIDGENLVQVLIANNANLRGQMETMISTSLEDLGFVASEPILVNVPASAWAEAGGIYIAAITGLTLDVEANYEVVFHTASEAMTDEIYLSLSSCFITPDSYDATTLNLKALLAKPEHDFELYLIKQ